ncbi:MAG: hypothetical protein IPL53_13220 [Ignavibacteria bacterium]|nr:hypothetical protein [Ignavibacteria bacterium]
MNDQNDKDRKIEYETKINKHDFPKKEENGKIELLYPSVNLPGQNVLPETLSLVDNSEEVSKLNPEIEILTTSDPDEEKIRKAIEDKFSLNKKNKNQPL